MTLGLKFIGDSTICRNFADFFEYRFAAADRELIAVRADHLLFQNRCDKTFFV